jgi:hypothetical protein
MGNNSLRNAGPMIRKMVATAFDIAKAGPMHGGVHLP